ncbi:MAG: hypothetical protein ACXABY_10215 [Candidatus Thorarchaeota archaeon]
MSIEFQYANPIQEDFVWNQYTESCFDGGIANGKTTGGCMRLLLLGSKYPGSRWVIARKTWIDLRRTSYETFHAKLCPPELIKDQKGETSGHNPRTILTNGTEYLWMHLDTADEKSLLSLEINGFFIDQAEEIDKALYDVLTSRTGRWQEPYRRGQWSEPCPAYSSITSNPKGHDWIYYHFHPDCNPPKHRGYFFAKTRDNLEMLESLDPTYYQRMVEKPESWKQKWLEGNREIFEGQIHRAFRRGHHVYNHKQFDPLKQRPISLLTGYFDYGLSSPTAVLVIAHDKEGFKWVVGEYYVADRKISEHATEIKKYLAKFNKRVEWIKADPSCFFTELRDREGPESITQDYARHGLYFVKGDNNEDTAIERINELLHFDKGRLHPISRERGSPNLFISDTCLNLIEEFPNQRWKERKNVLSGETEFVEERNPNVPDHAYDCLRYMANDVQNYQPYTGKMKRLSLTYGKAGKGLENTPRVHKDRSKAVGL